MERYVIAGGYPLEGSLFVDGAKNAALPILGASLLISGTSVIHRVPDLSDVRTMCEILRELGVQVHIEQNSVILNTSSHNNHAVPDHLMSEMRSSIFLMGALLGSCGAVRVSYPGGCAIGSRPIDLHLKGLRALGSEINERHGYIEAKAKALHGADIFLDFPSVGATENIMLAAVKATGTTIIRNAAKEPEIADLQNFLNAAGAAISGAGTDTITVRGVKELHSIEYSVIPDRIAAGTYMLAVAATGGDVELKGIIHNHIIPLIIKVREMGVDIEVTENTMRVRSTGDLKAIDTIRTFPYPGFPTDLQAPVMAALTVANGTSMITENIFEARFKHVSELVRLGAQIKVEGRTAVVKGVPGLTGAAVKVTDLRAGAALVIAGLVSKGLTIVEDIYHIDRGYAGLENELRRLGAHIERVGY